jgi:MFS family permease
MSASSVPVAPLLPEDGALSLEGERHNRSRTGILSWALYDLANTIFSFNVVSYIAPLWVLAVYRAVGRGAGEANLALGLAVGISMLLNALVSPVMGAISDRAGVRKPFLLTFTILCTRRRSRSDLSATGSGPPAAARTWFGPGVRDRQLLPPGGAHLLRRDAGKRTRDPRPNHGAAGSLGVGTIIGPRQCGP